MIRKIVIRTLLPLVLFLARMGVVSAGFLIKNFKFAVLVMVILSAVIGVAAGAPKVPSLVGAARSRGRPCPQTERVIRAMRNPHVDIIFHPTGRVLNRRDTSDLDIDGLIAAARATGTALEVAYFLFEVPTGVVADLRSRKVSVVVAAFVSGAAMLLIGAVLLTLPGRITRLKGHEDFIELIARLKRRVF